MEANVAVVVVTVVVAMVVAAVTEVVIERNVICPTLTSISLYISNVRTPTKVFERDSLPERDSKWRKRNMHHHPDSTIVFMFLSGILYLTDCMQLAGPFFSC